MRALAKLLGMLLISFFNLLINLSSFFMYGLENGIP